MKRRYEELKAKGAAVTLEQTRREVEKRDRDDASRDLSPMKPAPDAEIVDGGGWTIEETARILADKVRVIEGRMRGR